MRYNFAMKDGPLGKGHPLAEIQNLAEKRQPAPGDSSIIPATEMPSAGGPSLLPLLLLISLMVFAAIVRVIATHNDLWLDELISLRIAHAVKTPWQILSAVHTDNNHYLNTLFLYYLKTGDPAPPVYRYLSVLWGVALVPAGYWLLARRSQAEAVILAGLLACSYPLIHFSSEARGYSGAVLGSLLACAALARWMTPDGPDGKGHRLLLGAIYGIALSLALLSHLTACLIWFSLAVGSLISLLGQPRRAQWISRWIALNLLPAAVLLTLYFLDLRFLTELGGPPMTVLHGLGRLLALGLGWPAKDAATVWIVLAPLMAFAVWQLAGERDAEQPLAMLLTMIYLLPLLCVLLMRPAFFSPRYFLVILPFVYVTAAMLLARLVPTRTGRIALLAVLALFLAGQAHLYANFLQVGRGQFSAVLREMAAQTPAPQFRVASNQDFRSSIELAYYAPRLLRNQLLLYIPRDSQAPVQADWYILHQEGYEPPGPAVLNVPDQPTWYRVAYFGASELSGQAFTIYRHQPVE
ncbi:MAG: hypothetical protein WB421_02430 [Terriglobales bacterium]